MYKYLQGEVLPELTTLDHVQGISQEIYFIFSCGGQIFKVSSWCSYPSAIPSLCAWVVSDFWATKYKNVEGMYGITCTVHDHLITLHSTVVSVFLKYSPFWLWKTKWPWGQTPCGKKLQAVSGCSDCLQDTSVFSPTTRN